MKLTKYLLSISLIFLITLSDLFSIIMESEIEIEMTDPVKAREESLASVKNKIVEKYIQSKIDFDSFENNYGYIHDLVLKNSDDYISKYSILDTKSGGKRFYLKLSADIKEKDLNSKLENMGFFLSTRIKPSVCLLLGQGDSTKPIYWWQNQNKEKNILTQEVESLFRRINFQVTEPIEQLRHSNSFLSMQEQLEIGNKSGCNYLLHGIVQKTTGKMQIKTSLNILLVKEKKEIARSEISQDGSDSSDITIKNASSIFRFSVEKISQNFLLINRNKNYLEISFSNVTNPSFFKIISDFFKKNKDLFDDLTLKKISNKRIFYGAVTGMEIEKLILRFERAEIKPLALKLNIRESNKTLDFTVFIHE